MQTSVNIFSAILLMMLIVAFIGLFLGWTSKPMTGTHSPAQAWRRRVARVGLFAVSAQVFLFIALLTPLVRYALVCRESVHVQELLLLIAIPCILEGRMQGRWLLIASAAFLPVVSWFLLLAEMAY